MSADISELVAGLEHSDPAERGKAAEELSRLGAGARGAAVPLVRACGDGSEQVREWAVAALEELGPPSPADADALSSLLGDKNADVGYWAATLLGRLAGEAAPAVAALAAALSSSPAMAVRQRAAWALGKIGPPAAAALGALNRSAGDENARLARLARRAIEQIGC